MTDARLLIVYNAEAGLIAGVKDSLHKLLSPDTYPCSLCALTHGTLRMDRSWKRFLARAPYEVRIHHRPDFHARYPGLDIDLPAVLIERDSGPQLLVGPDDLGRISDVGQLIARIEAALAAAPANS